MAANMEQIAKILDSDAFDASDKWVVEWQYGFLGDFETALAVAITKADEMNLIRLANVFFKQVEGYRRWTRGDLGERLRKAGLSI